VSRLVTRENLAGACRAVAEQLANVWVSVMSVQVIGCKDSCPKWPISHLWSDAGKSVPHADRDTANLRHEGDEHVGWQWHFWHRRTVVHWRNKFCKFHRAV